MATTGWFALVLAVTLAAGIAEGAGTASSSSAEAALVRGNDQFAFDLLYVAGLTPLDFRSTPEKARMMINGWVEQQARDRIKNLIPERAVDQRTRLVLTNAIYFKGVWNHPFPEPATQSDALPC